MRIGIDLGGTKIEAIALDGDGRERFRHRVATPRGDYGATVEAVASLVAQAEASSDRSTVGVGMPGVVSPATGLVKNANSTWLNGRPLSEDLAARLERPVRLANDANCFALSEATDGAAAGQPVVFGVILGTGVGGGLVVNGRVVTGANAIAGEWGHNPLPWPEAGEWPGSAVLLRPHRMHRDVSLGARTRARFQGPRPAAKSTPPASSPRPRPATPTHASRSRDTNTGSRAGWRRSSTCSIPTRSCSAAASRTSPVSTSVCRGLWPEFVFSDTVVTRLVRAVHGDSSGVRGAAWLWE